MVKRPTTDKREPRTFAEKRARPGPEPLADLLGQARDTAARRAGVGLDHETWREVAGDRVALRTAPGGIENGVLTVVVSSPVWAQELSFLSEEIVGRLVARGLSVRSIRFRTGVVPERSKPPPARRLPRPMALSADAQERLAKVDDPELRAVIAEAMGQSLANAERLTPKPGARGPRSAGPETARSAPGAPKRSAGSRRSSEEE